MQFANRPWATSRGAVRPAIAFLCIPAEAGKPEYGGRGYGAEDIEGYLWSFGSYRPESASS